MSPLSRKRGRNGRQRPVAADEGSSGGALRKLLLALGVAAVAYAVARRFGSGETLPGDGHQISIGDVGGDSDEEGEEGEDDQEAEGDGDEAGDDDAEQAAEEDDEQEEEAREAEDDEAESDEDIEQGAADDGEESTGAGDDGVDEAEMDPDEPEAAIEERAEEDAHSEPMEPGEMTVDDEVVEELDDEIESDEGES